MQLVSGGHKFLVKYGNYDTLLTKVRQLIHMNLAPGNHSFGARLRQGREEPLSGGGAAAAAARSAYKCLALDYVVICTNVLVKI